MDNLGESTPTFLYSIATILRCKILWTDPVVALVSLTIVTMGSTAFVDHTLPSKGAKLTVEETIDERNLRPKIMKDVKTRMSMVATIISDNIKRRMAKAKVNIQGTAEVYYKGVKNLLERNGEDVIDANAFLAKLPLWLRLSWFLGEPVETKSSIPWRSRSRELTQPSECGFYYTRGDSSDE